MTTPDDRTGELRDRYRRQMHDLYGMQGMGEPQGIGSVFSADYFVERKAFLEKRVAELEGIEQELVSCRAELQQLNQHLATFENLRPKPEPTDPTLRNVR